MTLEMSLVLLRDAVLVFVATWLLLFFCKRGCRAFPGEAAGTLVGLPPLSHFASFCFLSMLFREGEDRREVRTRVGKEIVAGFNQTCPQAAFIRNNTPRISRSFFFSFVVV